MAASNNFRREQRRVAIRMAAALCVTILVTAGCMYLSVPASRPMPDRLIAVARADLFVLFWLVATIGNVARLRFFSANDIAGSASTKVTADISRPAPDKHNEYVSPFVIRWFETGYTFEEFRTEYHSTAASQNSGRFRIDDRCRRNSSDLFIKRYHTGSA